ncbi:MAG TPA: hypothetical protein VNM70_10765 [Burkholderiales bacterium]|nr:hypothetical protein [Burkholderiales bacterium]
MSDFDPIKALKEEITGMSDVANVIAAQARESEATLAEAEAKHSALVKMDAFMKDGLRQMREKLQAMETALENVAKGGG